MWIKMNGASLFLVIVVVGFSVVASFVEVEIVSQEEENHLARRFKRKAVPANRIWLSGDVAYNFTQKVGEIEACVDKQELCGLYAQYGHCTISFAYMNLYCKLACNFCGKSLGSRIEEAMEDFTKFTCLSFRKTTDDDINYILFKTISNGCFSETLGVLGGEQDVNIKGNTGGSGCDFKHIILHEIGHAIGLYHEQSRPDRDDYVEIIMENIRAGKEHNFKIGAQGLIDTHGVPYDYYSIMHYERDDFSKNGNDTIRTKNPAYQSIIGSTQILSLLDIAIINQMYGCATKYYRIVNVKTLKDLTVGNGTLDVTIETEQNTDGQLWFLDHKYIRNKANPDKVLAATYNSTTAFGQLGLEDLEENKRAQTWELVDINFLQNDFNFQVLSSKVGEDGAFTVEKTGAEDEKWVFLDIEE